MSARDIERGQISFWIWPLDQKIRRASAGVLGFLRALAGDFGKLVVICDEQIASAVKCKHNSEAAFVIIGDDPAMEQSTAAINARFVQAAARNTNWHIDTASRLWIFDQDG